ncbi:MULTISPECIES: hypothetical protein [unclassified Streptomyces]|nr:MULTISPECIES: hypothetical protein [unclassified Streptomyces]
MIDAAATSLPAAPPGTLSFLSTVYDHGHPQTVAYVGGTALGFQNDQ